MLSNAAIQMCWIHPFSLSSGLLLVTTPFTLARLLSCCCFLFGRLYHLVLDEADRLFTLAPEQVMKGAGPLCRGCCWGLSYSSTAICQVLILSLLPDGDDPATLSEGDLRPGKEPLPSTARRCGKAVEQSDGSDGCDSHAVPLHCSWHSSGKLALWECAAGGSWQKIKAGLTVNKKQDDKHSGITHVILLGWTNRSVFSSTGCPLGCGNQQDLSAAGNLRFKTWRWPEDFDYYQLSPGGGACVPGKVMVHQTLRQSKVKLELKPSTCF